MSYVILYSILFLLTSPVAGYILFWLTTDEKELIEFYFRPILLILFVICIVFYFVNLMYAFVMTYMFISLFIWYRLTKRIKTK
jgi:Flp pilus assembly protein TadB